MVRSSPLPYLLRLLLEVLDQMHDPLGPLLSHLILRHLLRDPPDRRCIDLALSSMLLLLL
jgi:hypothetical protein